uniref:Major facilitator superfamily (MFS) profile domain-containing protein n=1 Tax=Photinus pyralis TaxID=7054 RepID=A0A1Y1MWM7_PHOPY
MFICHLIKSIQPTHNATKVETEVSSNLTLIKMIETVVEKLIPKSAKGRDFVQISSIFVVSIGAFSAGALFAWPSPTIPLLIRNTSYIGQISIEEASYLSILPAASMIASSFLIASATKYIGRKPIIWFMAIPQALSWILIAEAKSITAIYIARVLNGIGEGILFSIAMAYVGEISTPAVRGTWGNMITCSVALGQLSIAAVIASMDIVTAAYIHLFAPLLQILLVPFLPESPHYLMKKGERENAKIALMRLRWKTDVDCELSAMSESIERQRSEAGSFKDLFWIPANRRALLLVLSLRTFQQLSGITAFVIYAQYIFELSGARSVSDEVSTIIVFASLFLFLLVCLPVAGKYSRRLLLTASSTGCTICLLINVVYFYIQEETEVDVSDISWIPLLVMVGYIAFLSIGLLPLPVLMIGELFALSIKNHGMFVSTVYLALIMIAFPKILQLLLSNFSLYVTFLFFTVSCFFSTIFCWFCVPETKGKTLEEIQQLLSKTR